ncbi:MAG: hypothetical protein HZA93_17860 [Verrucomicrobia bacterium]|nr:hypothetical protein [Verrucomicrobiota bacterium]
MRAETFPRRVTDVDQTAQTLRQRHRQFREQPQFVAFAPRDRAAALGGEHIRVGLHPRGSGDRLSHRLLRALGQRLIDAHRQRRDGGRERRREIPAVIGQPHLVTAIHAMLRTLQPAEHHLGPFMKIFVQENRLFSERLALPPRDAGFPFARCPLP